MALQVSVVIPVYNAARYLREAAESALRCVETCQVLLVEDGSTDGSLELCRELAAQDARVALLRHPGGAHRGAAASRNLGIGAARAELLGFLDADDYYLPGRFEVASRLLHERPDLDGVYDAVGTRVDDPALAAWAASQYGPDGMTTVRAQVPPEELLPTLAAGRHGWFCTDGVVVRSSLLARTGMFWEGSTFGEDTALFFRMAAVGRLAGGSLDRPVAMRRLHGANTIILHRARKAADLEAVCQRLFWWACERELGVEVTGPLLSLAAEALDRGPELQARQLLKLWRLLLAACLRRPGLVRTRCLYRELARASGALRLLRRPGG